MNNEATIHLTAEIVQAHVSNNSVSIADLPVLIAGVHAALAALAQPIPEPGVEYAGAVSIKKSLANPEHIISMIDGKPYKMLKRHLMAHGITPDEYRARYNLPASYPMTAVGYSEMRRDLALKIGLGHHHKG